MTVVVAPKCKHPTKYWKCAGSCFLWQGQSPKFSCWSTYYVKYIDKGLNFGSLTTVLSCKMTMPQAIECCWAVYVKEKNLMLEFIWFLMTFTLPKMKSNVKGKRSEDIQDFHETWRQWWELSCKTVSNVVSNSGIITQLTTAVLGHYLEA